MDALKRKSESTLFFNIIIGIVLIVVSVIVISVINHTMLNSNQRQIREEYHSDIGASYSGMLNKINITTFIEMHTLIKKLIKDDDNSFTHSLRAKYFETFRDQLSTQTDDVLIADRTEIQFYNGTHIVSGNFKSFFPKAILDCTTNLNRVSCSFKEVLK